MTAGAARSKERRAHYERLAAEKRQREATATRAMVASGRLKRSDVKTVLLDERAGHGSPTSVGGWRTFPDMGPVKPTPRERTPLPEGVTARVVGGTESVVSSEARLAMRQRERAMTAGVESKFGTGERPVTHTPGRTRPDPSLREPEPEWHAPVSEGSVEVLDPSSGMAAVIGKYDAATERVVDVRRVLVAGWNSAGSLIVSDVREGGRLRLLRPDERLGSLVDATDADAH